VGFSDKVPPPPGVVVAARRQLEDSNDEAQYGDRIPYVIARGAPQERLVDRAVAPEELFDGFVYRMCYPQLLISLP
jgi:DNA polymerase zeta